MHWRKYLKRGSSSETSTISSERVKHRNRDPPTRTTKTDFLSDSFFHSHTTSSFFCSSHSFLMDIFNDISGFSSDKHSSGTLISTASFTGSSSTSATSANTSGSLDTEQFYAELDGFMSNHRTRPLNLGKKVQTAIHQLPDNLLHGTCAHCYSTEAISDEERNVQRLQCLQFNDSDQSPVESLDHLVSVNSSGLTTEADIINTSINAPINAIDINMTAPECQDYRDCITSTPFSTPHTAVASTPCGHDHSVPASNYYYPSHSRSGSSICSDNLNSDFGLADADHYHHGGAASGAAPNTGLSTTKSEQKAEQLNDENEHEHDYPNIEAINRDFLNNDLLSDSLEEASPVPLLRRRAVSDADYRTDYTPPFISSSMQFITTKNQGKNTSANMIARKMRCRHTFSGFPTGHRLINTNTNSPSKSASSTPTTTTTSTSTTSTPYDSYFSVPLSSETKSKYKQNNPPMMLPLPSTPRRGYTSLKSPTKNPSRRQKLSYIHEFNNREADATGFVNFYSSDSAVILGAVSPSGQSLRHHKNKR